jgi:membrane-associated phospholipid phosphatase
VQASPLRTWLIQVDNGVLLRAQRACRVPGVVVASRALSLIGDHSAGWLLASASGALLGREQRQEWLRVGAAALSAHATAVAVKHHVRRRRPALPDGTVHVRTPSDLSFPSAHASSTTAFVVAAQPLVGAALLPVAVAMAVGRVLLGVHFPSDVVAGAALGAVVGRAVR